MEIKKEGVNTYYYKARTLHEYYKQIILLLHLAVNMVAQDISKGGANMPWKH